MYNYEKYVNVLLPFAFEQTLVYGVPEEFLDSIEIGKRVEVQMGKNKVYAGLIIEIIHSTPPVEIKPILSVLDNYSILNEEHLDFWKWIADYYLCSLGEVMQAALPALFKLDSRTVYLWIGDEVDESELNFEEWSLFKIFSLHKKLTVQEIKKYYTKASVTTLLSRWQQNKWIEREEVFEEKYKSKKEKYIVFNEAVKSNLDVEYNNLTTDKQKQLFEFLIEQLSNEDDKILKKNILSGGYSLSALQTLVKKEVVREVEEKVDRIIIENPHSKRDLVLSDFQVKAYQEVEEAIKENKPCLLFGVTSSGKTMIYIQMALKAMSEGKQVLWLLPEIALTSQIIDKVRLYISRFLVYHSRFNDAEQSEIWMKVREESSLLILGTRSSMFLPFNNLGLIIVDEEHDASYKQTNPSPRYNVRDVVVYLALNKKIPIVLGSATPSIESFYNTQKDKYSLVKMERRFSDIPPPEVKLVDMKRSKKKREYDGLLTLELREAIQSTVSENKKVLLFHNRRGYAPYMQCDACGYIPMCKRCDVSLTYHKYLNVLLCHYCGYKENRPNDCPSCNEGHIQIRGLGTQRIEEEISLRYRDLSVGRMDYDTTRGKTGHNKIIRDFESGKWDILVGTQMITKGLDFDEVALVGVLNTDVLFTIPDYKTMERAFQLLVQFIGRSGRKSNKGSVIIQTSNINQHIFKKVIDLDYLGFYNEQMEERKMFLYPPMVKLIKLTLKNKDKSALDEDANLLSEELSKNKNLVVLGPVEPILSKIDNKYIIEFYIKIKRDKLLAENKIFVKNSVKAIKSYAIIDVDC